MPLNGGPAHSVVDNTQSVENISFGQLTISPDRKTVVMSGTVRNRSGDSTSLYKAPFSATTTAEAKIIPGTTLKPLEDSRTHESNEIISPAFSPDGRSIAYNVWAVKPSIGTFLVEEIRTIPAAGGTSTVIVPSGNSSNFMHLNLLWAPNEVMSMVPEVIDTEPDDGATQVVRTIKPEASFNTELDASTVNAQNVRLEVYNPTKQKWVALASTPSYGHDTKTITVTPAGRLGSQKEYRVILSTGIKSSTGDALASPYSWSFATST